MEEVVDLLVVGKKNYFWMGFFSLSAFLLAVTAGDSAYYGKITLAA
jgi:hypothetical protein